MIPLLILFMQNYGLPRFDKSNLAMTQSNPNERISQGQDISFFFNNKSPNYILIFIINILDTI